MDQRLKTIKDRQVSLFGQRSSSDGTRQRGGGGGACKLLQFLYNPRELLGYGWFYKRARPVRVCVAVVTPSAVAPALRGGGLTDGSFLSSLE